MLFSGEPAMLNVAQALRLGVGAGPGPSEAISVTSQQAKLMTRFITDQRVLIPKRSQFLVNWC